VIVVVAVGVGEGLGCCGEEKGFGVFGFCICSVEQNAASRLSKQAAKSGRSCGGASSGCGGLEEKIGVAGAVAMVIAAAAERWCCAWRRLSWV